MRMFLATLMSVFLATAAIGEDTADPTGRILLTIGGAVEKSNAPGFKAEAVNVAGFLGVVSEKAFAFDDIMLAGLDQHEITANLLDTGKDITYTGPRLSTVMMAVGAEGKTASPMALDGYQAELDWNTIKKYEPILATHADGRPLVVGKLGPAMVVFPVVDDPETNESFKAMQVFATFYINAE